MAHPCFCLLVLALVCQIYEMKTVPRADSLESVLILLLTLGLACNFLQTFGAFKPQKLVHAKDKVFGTNSVCY